MDGFTNLISFNEEMFTEIVERGYDFYNDKRQKQTVPVILNAKEEWTINEMMKNEPVFKIDENTFKGRALTNGVTLKYDGRSSSKKILDFLNRKWVPEVKAYGRYWAAGYGLIPYRIYSSYGISTPKICLPGTGKIYVSYNMQQCNLEYFWVSHYREENTTSFKNTMLPRESRYDGRVRFHVIKGESPDEKGHFKSLLSYFIKMYNKIMFVRRLSDNQDMKRTRDPMVIEEIMPKSEEEIKFLQKLNEIELEEAAEQDFRQFPDQTRVNDPIYSETTRTTSYSDGGGAGKGVQSYKTVKFEVLEKKPQWPDMKGMKFKFLPGQKFQKYDVQSLESKIEELELNFERMLGAALGSVFNPWAREITRTMSDAHLIQSQLFTSTVVSNELSIYEDLMKLWYWQIYGHAHIDVIRLKWNEVHKKTATKRKKGIRKKNRVTQRSKPPDDVRFNTDKITGKKRKRKSKEDDNMDKAGDIMNRPPRKKFRRTKRVRDRDIEALNIVHELEVKFLRRPFIVRPGLELIDRLYYAGAISKDEYRKIMSDVTQIPIGSVSQEKLFEGVQKQQGVWIDEKSLGEQLKAQHNLTKYMEASLKKDGQGGGSSGSSSRGGKSTSKKSQQSSGGGGGGGNMTNSNVMGTMKQILSRIRANPSTQIASARSGSGQKDKLRIRGRTIK